MQVVGSDMRCGIFQRVQNYNKLWFKLSKSAIYKYTAQVPMKHKKRFNAYKNCIEIKSDFY